MIWIFLLAILVVGATVFISSLYVVKQQSVAIIAAFPIGLIIILIVASFLKDLKAYEKEM